MNILNSRWVLILFACLLAHLLPPQVSAQTVPFKVYITGLTQLDDGVDPVLGLIGDYYAIVTINGVKMNNKQGSDGACDDETSTTIIVPLTLFTWLGAIPQCSVPTPWVFTAQVPPGQPVQVNIDIFDADLFSDDEADATPGPGKSINLLVDPATGGKWSGDINWPQDCSRPDGLELGNGNVNVCFQVGFDTDDDGLLDVWELYGVDTDNDGVIDLDLPTMGANPMRKDIFVEADYLQATDHSHAPQEAAIKSIVTSFANAPVQNPDNTTGVQLHVDVGPLYGTSVVTQVAGGGGVTGNYGDFGGGNSIAEAGNEIIEGFDTPHGSGASFADLKNANFDFKRRPFFRYVIWGHQTNVRAASNDCTSGDTSATRRDYMVTLGGNHSDGTSCESTVNGFSVGNTDEQAGTFMHETGHSLGLRHGGDVDVNNKPNYLSVMNYTFQFCSLPASPGLLPGGCDYSRLVSGMLLPPLDETNLDECVGIGGGLGFGGMDWNHDNALEGVSRCESIGTNVMADVNFDGACVSPGVNGVLDSVPIGDDRINNNIITDGPNRTCETAKAPMTDDVQSTAVGSTPPQPNPLNSFDDWDAINPQVFGFATASGSGTSDIEPEADSDTLKQARENIGLLTTPLVSLSETGPATAKPGDQLTYVITATNTGRGPATSAVLQATNPDGTIKTSALGTIPVGSSNTQNTTFIVPANACPGSFTGASALLAFTDFAAQALSASASAPLQILDVMPPTVDISLSPSVLWPPDHKFVEVTATITAKDNCDPNPSVTLVSITSNEPDTGFLGNGDQGPDIQGAAFGTDDRVFSLRSERGTGKGSTGRIYTVTYRVTDKSGNATVKNAIVTVPTSQGGN